ncbi:Uncharacterised protein [Klebsiella pneumoniae]|nr:Uncharacterised protein [Klebsiella pneumoniae]SYH23823.1 Uncharacterised protein [Klebsiella pneumoniae]
MLTWRWSDFIYLYVIFSWGTVIQQIFSSEAWIAVLFTSILLAFRLKELK